MGKGMKFEEAIAKKKNLEHLITKYNDILNSSNIRSIIKIADKSFTKGYHEKLLNCYSLDRSKLRLVINNLKKELNEVKEIIHNFQVCFGNEIKKMKETRCC
jgi:hypothetical protein